MLAGSSLKISLVSFTKESMYFTIQSGEKRKYEGRLLLEDVPEGIAGHLTCFLSRQALTGTYLASLRPPFLPFRRRAKKISSFTGKGIVGSKRYRSKELRLSLPSRNLPRPLISKDDIFIAIRTIREGRMRGTTTRLPTIDPLR